MRELLRKFNNFWRRLRYKMSDGRALVLSGRWLAFALLVAAVAAVGVWGGQGEPGGINAWLQTSWQQQPDEPLMVKTAGETGEQAEKNAGQALPAASNTVTVNEDEPAAPTKSDESDETDEPQVYDNAPEPWVGDAVLQAEADLLALGAPLSNFNGQVLRSYGYGFDESFGDYRFHRGLDWQAEEGSAVLAVLSGQIAEITRDDIYGAGVVLNHGEKLQIVYYGLEPNADLQAGDEVAAGDKLGVICAPPLFEDAYPAHLHLEIWLDDEAVDPADYGLNG